MPTSLNYVRRHCSHKVMCGGYINNRLIQGKKEEDAKTLKVGYIQDRYAYERMGEMEW